tara:strand:- start:6432 stop:7610 length:1179 start_codon:yes stop_codon:yes gene_type:complete
MKIKNQYSTVKKKKILCLVENYLPGYKFGGPVRSIANFVENLGDEYDIYVVCLIEEFLLYKDISFNKWNKIGKAKVYYIPNKFLKFFNIFRLLRDTKYDVIYLNSFFSITFTIFPLFIRKLQLIKLTPCVIAPRGELAKNALKIKKTKKSIYKFFSKIIRLYQNLFWQASSELEANDIKRELKNFAKSIYIAPDLISTDWTINNNIARQKNGNFKLIFLSRISPMKNLDFLLSVLSGISSPLELSIIGPKEDLLYWKHCNKLLKKLPTNIKINISDGVLPEQVYNKFNEHDLFVFPTRGENFGHVVIESLSSGTPVLISDKTSWKEDPSFAIQVLPLDKYKWLTAIREWVKLSEDKLLARKKAAIILANYIKLQNKDFILKNKKFFDNILNV